MDFDYDTETITPDNTNLLTIGGSGGFELPIGTTLQRPVTGIANGALRYNTDLSVIEGYVALSWTPLSTGSTSITLTGDVTGTGTSTIATTLATVNANVGTFASVTVNGKGLVTAAAPLSGDITTSGSVATLATVLTATVGTFAAATFNGKGLATATSNLSGDATTTGAVITLATVNASPQTDTFRKITVNGKGLTTATSAVLPADITTALGFTPVNLAGDTMTGLLILSGDPVTGLGAATKQYVDAAIAGLSWKQAVRAATTVNGALATAYANGQTVDGVVLATGNRILIKNQTTQTENGIYVVQATGAPVRSTDADSGPELVGATVYVDQGTLNADTGWTQTTNAPITIGTSNIVWVQFSGSGSYTAGAGLTLTGNTFSITAPVSPALGGTGTTTAPTAGQVMIGTSGGVYIPATITGTAGNIVVSSTTGAISVNLATAGTAGTYGVVTTDTFGRVTSGSIISPVVNGGTGAATLTANGVLLGNGTTAVSATAVGATGTVLAGNTAAAPTFQALSGIAVTTFQTSLAGLTPNTATSGAITLAGTLGAANGGTGATTLTANGVVYGNGTGTVGVTAVGAAGTVLTGTGAAPTYTALNTIAVTSFTQTLPSFLTQTGATAAVGAVNSGVTLTSQTANTAFLAPNGSAGVPTFRLLAYADLPLKLYQENPSSPIALTTTGVNSIATGSGTTTTGISSQASGLQSVARVYGERAYSSGRFATNGDAQHGEYNLRIITSNATATEMLLDGVGGTARLVLPANSAYMFVVDIVGRRTDATGGRAAFTITGLIFQDATVGTTAFQGTPAVTTIARSTATIVAAVVADTTNGALRINVSGLAAQTWRWSAYVRTQEVTN